MMKVTPALVKYLLPIQPHVCYPCREGMNKAVSYIT